MFIVYSTLSEIQKKGKYGALAEDFVAFRKNAAAECNMYHYIRQRVLYMNVFFNHLAPVSLDH